LRAGTKIGTTFSKRAASLGGAELRFIPAMPPLLSLSCAAHVLARKASTASHVVFKLPNMSEGENEEKGKAPAPLPIDVIDLTATSDDDGGCGGGGGPRHD